MGINTKINKAVFFDRDGVLNKCPAPAGKPVPPIDAEHLEIYEDAQEALDLLRNQGFILLCVTNQPDVARGTRSVANVKAMNNKVQSSLHLHKIYTCLHDNKDNCKCRKPKPGMLYAGARDFNLDLAGCFMIGDRASDIFAGQNAGCKTVFLRRGYKEPEPIPSADFVCVTLLEATQWILNYIQKTF